MASGQISFIPWDARRAYPDGILDTPDTTGLGVLRDLVRDAADIIVLPGPEPHQAILMVVDKPSL